MPVHVRGKLIASGLEESTALMTLCKKFGEPTLVDRGFGYGYVNRRTSGAAQGQITLYSFPRTPKIMAVLSVEPPADASNVSNNCVVYECKEWESTEHP